MACNPDIRLTPTRMLGEPDVVLGGGAGLAGDECDRDQERQNTIQFHEYAPSCMNGRAQSSAPGAPVPYRSLGLAEPAAFSFS